MLLAFALPLEKDLGLGNALVRAAVAPTAPPTLPPTPPEMAESLVMLERSRGNAVEFSKLSLLLGAMLLFGCCPWLGWLEPKANGTELLLVVLALVDSEL